MPELCPKPAGLQNQQIAEVRPVTANALPWHLPVCYRKSQFLLRFCPLPQRGETTNSQISYLPLNKTLKVADSSWMNSTLELCSNLTTFLR